MNADENGGNPRSFANSKTFNRATFARFKVAYAVASQSANGDGQAVFEFDGADYVLGYANYLIQFLETQFGK
jgi:hypothetical protein